MKQTKRKLQWIWIAALYLVIWGGASLLVGKELLLPSPWATIGRFFELLGQAESWMLAGRTLARIMSGYLLGILAGVLAAILCAKVPFANDLLAPLKSIIKATPVTSFILLALLWLSSDLVPVFISFLMVLPVVWASTLEALLQIDPQLMEMARVYRLDWWKKMRSIQIPSVLPQTLAACTTALGFAWKAGVAAEIIALPRHSIGYQLYQSKLRIETVDLFAWTLLVILLSMLLEKVLVWILRRIRHD